MVYSCVSIMTGLKIFSCAYDYKLWEVVKGEGQGSLVCCSPWGHKKSDTT